jgi:hypothetical protein
VFWGAINDIVLGSLSPATVMASYPSLCYNLRTAWIGAHCFTMDMMSWSNATDSTKDTFDTLMRAQAPNFSNFISISSDANLGADGANTNTTYFNSGNPGHPTQAAATNIIAPMVSRAIAADYGPQDFSDASVYTATPDVSITLVSCTESGSTATCTFLSTTAPTVGSCATIVSNTVSSYNSATNECWQILTSSSTSVTFTAYASSLGTGTGGTLFIPGEKDVDTKYFTLGGSAASQAITLQRCEGQSFDTLVQITNASHAWTINPFSSSETINGASSLTSPTASSSVYPVVRFHVINNAPSAGGCNWTASVQ